MPRSPFVVHQDERLAIGGFLEIECVDYGPDEMRWDDGIAVASRDDLPPRLQEADVVADVLVIHARLAARDPDVSLFHRLGDNPVIEFDPDELVTIPRNILFLEPLKGLEPLADRPI